MASQFDQLASLLENSNVDGFLSAFKSCLESGGFEPRMSWLTQVRLPRLLREVFESDSASAHTVLALWQLTLRGHLLLIDNGLRAEVNKRLFSAWEALGNPRDGPPLPLALLADEDDVSPRHPRPRTTADTQPVVQVKRVAILSSFTVRTWAASDAFDFRRNLCESNQEREFLKAIRQYFPSLLAYPNVPLQQFIELDRLSSNLPARVSSFALRSRVDVLLCTVDEDPVAGIELDSGFHDREEAIERDEMKNSLFATAGLHLVRIRAYDTGAVRAEDFFSLLCSEAESLAKIRPPRYRPRRSHEGLVPAEAYAAGQILTPRPTR